MDEDFEKRAYERQRARWEEDSDDLNREAAGIQGNRISRFFQDDAHANLISGKDKGADDYAEFVVAELLATAEEIARVRYRIDMLDRASLEALRETEDKMEKAREDLERVRDNAHQLPDGRKVYRTEDGKTVYDDDGNEVDGNLIDPADIPGNRPTWEQRNKAGNRVEDLEMQRQDIQHYRSRLDRTRDALKQDGITQDELDELDKELENGMPAAVREHRDRLAAGDPNVDPAPSRTTSAAAERDGKLGFEAAPELGESFAVAVAGLPDTVRQEPAAPTVQPRDEFTV